MFHIFVFSFLYVHVHRVYFFTFYLESNKTNKIGKRNTPIAEELQKNIMNFTTNQETNQERMIQVDALMNTLKHFGYKI